MDYSHFSRKRLNDRAIDELVGLSKGIIADHIVTVEEAEYLKNWVEVNVPCCEDPMVNQIYRRVHEMLIDGKFDDDEKAELMELLKMFSGSGTAIDAKITMTSTLPLDDPMPNITFDGSGFCLTGTFAYGPRKLCSEVIKELGGVVQKNVTLGTDYLVTGYLGTSAWIHSTYGRKIEKAMEYRKSNGRLAIISEDHWVEHVMKEQ